MTTVTNLIQINGVAGGHLAAALWRSGSRPIHRLGRETRDLNPSPAASCSRLLHLGLVSNPGHSPMAAF
jgi:hypothetical protein